MYKGWKLLTVKERKHLSKVANVHSTASLERTFTEQAKLRKMGGEPCWECKNIAKKLGYPL